MSDYTRGFETDDSEAVGRPRTPALSANVTVAAGTAISRLTGFLRFAVFGVIFGRAALWDAYNAANNSPNMIYELVLGGVLSATLVPVFTRMFLDEDEESAGAVVSCSLIAVGVLAVVAVIGAPWIFHISSIHVSKTVDATQYRYLGTQLARIFLIQIFFYGLSALWGALLNARSRFFAPAWAPILSNLAIIISLVAAKMQLKHGTDSFVLALHDAKFRYTLGIGATAGIALQAFALLPALRQAGIRIPFRPDFGHPAVKKVFRLSAWTIGYALANIVAAQVVQNLAKPGSGNASAYTLAYTFFQLPHALLAMSVLTTFVPDLAGSVKRADRQGFVSKMSTGVRIVALFTVPAGFGLFALRRPILGALLQHGRFTSLDALVTSRALAGFALGLGGYSIYLFALRGFYSHQDTRTAFTINLFENLFNIVLAVALAGRYGVLGLGAAFGLAYVVSAIWALQVLGYKVPGFDFRGLLLSLGKTALAATVMAEVIWFATHRIGSNVGMGAAARIVVGIMVGIVVYAGVIWALGYEELEQVKGVVSRVSTRRRHRP
jgi:putative peptidoglycan lipid II flippase